MASTRELLIVLLYVAAFVALQSKRASKLEPIKNTDPLLLPDSPGAAVPLLSKNSHSDSSKPAPTKPPAERPSAKPASPSSAPPESKEKPTKFASPAAPSTSPPPSPPQAQEEKPTPPKGFFASLVKLLRRLIALAAIIVPVAVTAEMLYLPSIRHHQTKGKASPTGGNHIIAIIDVLLSIHPLVIPAVAIAIGFLIMAVLERMVSLLLSGLVGGGVAAGLLYFVTEQHKARALAMERHIKQE